MLPAVISCEFEAGIKSFLRTTFPQSAPAGLAPEIFWRTSFTNRDREADHTNIWREQAERENGCMKSGPT
jgi:hypothetical protein